MSTLIDSFGRIHKDLRVSLTDRCTLRCTYCMPHDFSDWIAKDRHLSKEEIVYIIGIAVDLGITSVRLTGGEPLMHPHIIEIIRKIKELDTPPELSMTTNGVALAEKSKELKLAGLDRLNISLDTLVPERFKLLTHRPYFDQVISGIQKAHEVGFTTIKINAVLIRGINDDEVIPLVKWALESNLNLRFIEQMPLDAGRIWSRQQIITADEIYQVLKTEFELEPVPNRDSSPAEDFYINGGPAKVGIIGSISRPFCGACDRIRLTSDGQLRSCLFSHEEGDLLGVLRDSELSPEQRHEKYLMPLGPLFNLKKLATESTILHLFNPRGRCQQLGVNMPNVHLYGKARALVGKSDYETSSATIREIIEELADFSVDMPGLLKTCSFLVDGMQISDVELILVTGSRVDVLPRFAGG